MKTILSLTAVFGLAAFLWMLVSTWDVGVSLRVSIAPAALVLTLCGILEYNVYLKLVKGREERAAWYPVLPVERIVEYALPTPLAVPSLNTGTTQRSIVLNANGASHTLALTPEPSTDALRVRAMLDVALSLPTRDPSRFPSVRAMERAGVAYAEYDAVLELIADKVLRTQSGIRVASGTVRELRDSV